jgi:chemotaxis-related protein WspB
MLVLTFQVGRERFALDVRRIHEVVPRVKLQRPAGAPAWLAGAFVYRGQVLPVIDLHTLIGAGDCPQHLSSRMILVAHRWQGEERLLGLLAAQVADIREVSFPDRPTHVSEPGQVDLGPLLVDDGGLLRLLDLDRFTLPMPPEGWPTRPSGPACCARPSSAASAPWPSPTSTPTSPS